MSELKTLTLINIELYAVNLAPVKETINVALYFQAITLRVDRFVQL